MERKKTSGFTKIHTGHGQGVNDSESTFKGGSLRAQAASLEAVLAALYAALAYEVSQGGHEGHNQRGMRKHLAAATSNLRPFTPLTGPPWPHPHPSEPPA